jgi:dihydroxyacetone kinase-like protein
VDEMLDGIIAAHPGHLVQLAESPRSIVARNGPRPGKVGLVIGGGSGHEPTFLGFVGRGLADAALHWRSSASCSALARPGC